MATLTSVDLRCRLVLQPLGLQFEEADNLYDLNWLNMRAGLFCGGDRVGQVRTRLLTWELVEIASWCQRLGRLEAERWRPRLLDSGLHLSLRRIDEGRTFQMWVVVSGVSGPLPAGWEQRWRDARLIHKAQDLYGLRFEVHATALGLFAEELAERARVWPLRTAAGGAPA